MKKTCMNCKHYYAVLASDIGHYHIHDWCDQWKTTLNAYALADKTEYDCPFNSDLETGDAYCYMFEALDTPSYPDEWFDKNKAENERNVKKQITYIIKKPEDIHLQALLFIWKLCTRCRRT